MAQASTNETQTLKQVVLKVTPLTPENIKPFGQVRMRMSGCSHASLKQSQ